MEKSQDFVSLKVIANLFEAHQLQAILDDAHIPYAVRSFHDTALDGIYQAQRGWGVIEVPKDRLADSKKLIEQGLNDSSKLESNDLETIALDTKNVQQERSAKPARSFFGWWPVVAGIGYLFLIVVGVLWEWTIIKAGRPSFDFFQVLVLVALFGLGLNQIWILWLWHKKIR